MDADHFTVPQRRGRSFVPVALAVLLLVPSLARAQDASGTAVPLFDNLGDHHMSITTAVPQAQRYFDQGIRLTYAFNHGEAIRAFREAQRLDPECAMCHWGEAYAWGPNINAPMDRDAGLAAHAAVERAWAVAAGASAREQALVAALAKRYAADPPDDRSALDQAFAKAMAEVADRYPDDLDAATIASDAAMNLRPWDYWTKEGEPHTGTRELVARLESVIERNPNHPGACHLYIHAVEAVRPELAVPCAERLARLMPGAGHMVHMPAHIYIRVGRWADAIDSNVHAIHADEEYIASEGPMGMYPLAYYPHNYHFLSFAAAMAGRSATAVQAARDLAERVDLEVARAVSLLQPMVAHEHFTLAVFGHWDAVLGLPRVSEEMPLAFALAEYARGISFAATGRIDEARETLAGLNRVEVPEADELGHAVVEIARHALEGDIALRTGDPHGAVAHYRVAAEIEDALPYMEPPFWPWPVRHSLGLALIEAGRLDEAARAYEEDLERFPANGWSLQGLVAVEKARGMEAKVAELEAQLRRAWQGADVRLTGSRF